jgi:hypothetical protein
MARCHALPLMMIFEKVLLARFQLLSFCFGCSHLPYFISVVKNHKNI